MGSSLEETAGFLTFTGKILNRKLHFLCVISPLYMLLKGTNQELLILQTFFTGIYLLKVNNRNTRTSSEICSKLTMKTPERRQWRCSGVFIINFEHISHLVLVFLLLTLNM